MILLIQKGENNPTLRRKSQPIDKIDENILDLIKDMIETMLKLDGVGLAGCQVGKNIQVFVINPNLSKKSVFINPKIIKMSKKTETLEEGCLSLPGIFINKARAKSLKIKAIDENGKQFKIKAKDILARAIQHEMDHLDGILIIDKNS
jgi:peptide deformylase